MDGKHIARALVLFIGSLGLIAFMLIYRPEPVEPKDTRLAPPSGGFAQVITLYIPETKQWHIKRIGSEVTR